jgi:DNA-binding response OmpR family regulator
MDRVFLAGADGKLRAVLSEYLQLESCEVKETAQLKGALEAVRRYQPDLVIMEDGDPSSSGLAFARDLREGSQIPLILISERNTESDRITALELGVDDFLGKPVSPREVVLRVKRLLRRSRSRDEDGSAVWRVGERAMRLDLTTHKTYLDGGRVALTAAEWRVLTFLVREGGAVASRGRIMEQCFQYSEDVYDRIVDTHVKNLRAKLGSHDWIETVKGFGYRFAGEPAEAADLVRQTSAL